MGTSNSTTSSSPAYSSSSSIRSNGTLVVLQSYEIDVPIDIAWELVQDFSAGPTYSKEIISFEPLPTYNSANNNAKNSSRRRRKKKQKRESNVGTKNSSTSNCSFVTNTNILNNNNSETIPDDKYDEDDYAERTQRQAIPTTTTRMSVGSKFRDVRIFRGKPEVCIVTVTKNRAYRIQMTSDLSQFSIRWLRSTTQTISISFARIDVTHTRLTYSMALLTPPGLCRMAMVLFGGICIKFGTIQCFDTTATDFEIEAIRRYKIQQQQQQESSPELRQEESCPEQHFEGD